MKLNKNGNEMKRCTRVLDREREYLQCKSMKSFMCQWNTKGVT